MKIRERALIDLILEAGIARGLNRAFKHADNPDKEHLTAVLFDELLNSVYEYVELEEGEI